MVSGRPLWMRCQSCPWASGACHGACGPDAICIVLGAAAHSSDVVHEVELCVSMLGRLEGDGVLCRREMGNDVCSKTEVHGGRVEANER